MNSFWLCLRTTTGKEYALAQALNSFGATSYAPRWLQSKRVFSRKTFTPRPFFPSYLFTAAEGYDAAQARIKQLPVSLRSYRVGNVDCEFVDQLQAREDESGYIVTVKEAMPYKSGENVIITSDMFNAIEAIFLSHTPERDRIRLLMTMMGAQRQVELNYSDIQISRPAYV